MARKGRPKLTRAAFLEAQGKKILQLDTLVETEGRLSIYARKRHISSGRKVAALILDAIMAREDYELVISRLIEDRTLP